MTDLTDRLGRRRRPEQNRGLRPLFPKLPGGLESRAIRIAMAAATWQRIDALMAEHASETRPRATGELIERLLANFENDSAPTDVATRSGPDWQVWQIRKERALLPSSSEFTN